MSELAFSSDAPISDGFGATLVVPIQNFECRRNSRISLAFGVLSRHSQRNMGALGKQDAVKTAVRQDRSAMLVAISAAATKDGH